MTMTDDRPRRTRGPRSVALLAVGILAAVALAGCGGDEDALAQRQVEIAQRGAEVMPFDLETTTHRFEPTDTGLVQTVVADDPDDRRQIELIRRHLEEAAARFARGDFDDPATIHGEDMPGLTELRAGAANIDVQLKSLDDGARIIYTADDPALIDALHRWGHAQITDHGPHAEHGS
jgi:hypothetical protein